MNPGNTRTDDGNATWAPRVALFTLTMDRLEYTQRMLSALRTATHIPLDIFVIDNGSTDGTIEYLRAHASDFAHVTENPQNRGISIGTNQALEAIGSDYDYVVKMDNDCEVISDGWLQSLIEVCEAMDRRVAVSPAVSGLSDSRTSRPDRLETVTVAGHELGMVRHLGGLCVLAPIEAWSGFRHGRAALHDNQDVDFSAHVRLRCGMATGYVEDVWVAHMDTTDGQHAKFPEYFDGRGREQQQVWGEPALVTSMLRPLRRALYLRRMKRLGLSDVSVTDWVMARLTRSAPWADRGSKRDT